MVSISEKPKYVVGSLVGFVIAALFNAILTVVKEEYEGVYDWLASTFWSSLGWTWDTGNFDLHYRNGSRYRNI